MLFHLQQVVLKTISVFFTTKTFRQKSFGAIQTSFLSAKSVCSEKLVKNFSGIVNLLTVLGKKYE